MNTNFKLRDMKMIIEHRDSDRNIVVFFNDEGLLYGVNFWQGIDEFSICEYFLKADDKITNYIDSIGKANIENVMTYIYDIDDGIWNFVHEKNN